MKVRAKALGFDGLHRRREGEVFDFEGKPSEKWMEPVDDAAREAFKKAGFKVTVAAPAAPEEGKGKGKGKGKEDADTPPGRGQKSTGDQEVI